MTGRTPFQATLLGDDTGSAMAWTLYRQGYERGAQSGYDRGYADAMAMLNDAGALLAGWRRHEVNEYVALQRRRNRPRPGLDRRTGAQIVAAAHESWGIIDRKDAAA